MTKKKTIFLTDVWRTVSFLGSIFQANDIIYVNLFIGELSNRELLTLKTGQPCIKHVPDLLKQYITVLLLNLYDLYFHRY